MGGCCHTISAGNAGEAVVIIKEEFADGNHSLLRFHCPSCRENGRNGFPDADGKSWDRGGQLPIVVLTEEEDELSDGDRDAESGRTSGQL